MIVICCVLQGKYDEAKPMFEESLRITRKVLGNGHPDVAQSLNSLAALLGDQVGLHGAHVVETVGMKIVPCRASMTRPSPCTRSRCA